ncbi:MAG: hypothetical protein WCI02_12175 [Planctomycetota bacterium]
MWRIGVYPALLGLLLGSLACRSSVGQEPPTQDLGVEAPITAGLRIGDELAPLMMRFAIGSQSGKEVDLIDRAGNGLLVVVFLNDVNRQSIALTRMLTRYAASRGKDGVTTGVVLLTEDTAQGIATLKRIQHTLIASVPTGVSLDGSEGPAPYQIDRQSQMTILVAKNKRVTASFILTQPSIQADLPRVIAALIEIVGGPEPVLKDLLAQEPAMLRWDESRSTGLRDSMKAVQSQKGAEMAFKVQTLAKPSIPEDTSDEPIDRAAQATDTIEIEEEEPGVP